MIQYFKEQLETYAPCNGDYLNGAPYEEARRKYLEERGAVTQPISGPVVTFDVDAFLESRIKMWKEHEGQRLVFFMVERDKQKRYKADREPGLSMEVLKCWEDEISSMAEQYVFLRMSLAKGGLPVFKRTKEANATEPNC